MATKNRIVYLMRYLRENSDENYPVTTAQIREEMAQRGCPITIPTLRDDIEALKDAGYDIQVNETEGLFTTYSWLDRERTLSELQILVDAVSTSQLITAEKSRELIDKLFRIYHLMNNDRASAEIKFLVEATMPNGTLVPILRTVTENTVHCM